MSEKRFVSEYVEIIDENGSRQAVCVTDTEHTVSFEVKDEYVAMELCDLLNEQQELIEELQEENKQLKLTLSEYGVDLKAFEIFKQKIGYYDKVIDDE